MMKSITWIVLAAAACGGGGAATKTTSTPPTTDPIPMTETAQPAAETKPAEPVEPAKPMEPAGPDPTKVKAELLAAEQTAYQRARPVFDKWCANCHTKGGKKAATSKLDHFDMTAYPFGGHHAMEFGQQIRKSLGIDGGKPTMPYNKKGAVKGDELALIAAWADAFDAAHEGGAHEGHTGHGGHEHQH